MKKNILVSPICFWNESECLFLGGGSILLWFLHEWRCKTLKIYVKYQIAISLVHKLYINETLQAHTHTYSSTHILATRDNCLMSDKIIAYSYFKGEDSPSI